MKRACSTILNQRAGATMLSRSQQQTRVQRVLHHLAPASSAAVASQSVTMTSKRQFASTATVSTANKKMTTNNTSASSSSSSSASSSSSPFTFTTPSASISTTKAACTPLINPSLPSFSTPAEMFAHIQFLTTQHDLIRNYIGVIYNMSPSALVIETPLFPKDSLEFYSKYNLLQLDIKNNSHDKALYDKYYTPARGGGQGDYRLGIDRKLKNVISSLRSFPNTKRAVLTIPFTEYGSQEADHEKTDEAKCLRELHFYLDGPAETKRKLACTGFMRAQAATIFPKNIHFIGTIMQHVAKELGVEVGSYTHIVTTMVNER